MIDFLFKNNFVDHETVRKIFQNKEILRMTAYYNFNYFQKEINYGINTISTDVDDLWFWPLRLSIFKQMSQQDVRKMNFEIFHEKLFNLIYHSYPNPDMEECRILCYQSLSGGKYLKKFAENRLIDSRNFQMNHSGYNNEQFDDPMDLDQDSKENEEFGENFGFEYEEDVKNLLIIRSKVAALDLGKHKDKNYYSFLNRHVHELLFFIEERLCPGIVKKGSKKWFANDQNHEDRVWLEHTLLKINDLKILVKGHQNFTKDKNNILNYPQIGNNLTHQYFHDKALDLYSKYLRICSRLESEDDSWYISTGKKYLYPCLNDGDKSFFEYLDKENDDDEYLKTFWSKNNLTS
ncbi:hypothetical protein PGTUg99_020245 [Puccinia graminis f. sp. tritici]|nr:hypothetical protein PGTUg99_020245 [Puccinia graminis f. sp. tritici]